MFFKQFPIIPYDSKGTGEFKNVTNLLRRVAIREKVKINTSFFDTYDVKNGDTPESIAFKLYGDAELHYVVMIVNDITDRFHDWPMTEAQFNSYVTEKYGDTLFSGIHHYEITQTSGDTKVKIDIGESNADFPSATAVTNYEYEVREQDRKRKIRLLDPSFVDAFVDEHRKLMKESVI